MITTEPSEVHEIINTGRAKQHVMAVSTLIITSSETSSWRWNSVGDNTRSDVSLHTVCIVFEKWPADSSLINCLWHTAKPSIDYLATSLVTLLPTSFAASRIRSRTEAVQGGMCSYSQNTAPTAVAMQAESIGDAPAPRHAVNAAA